MLQAEGAEFQILLLILFNGTWESHVQSTDWQLSPMHPIYKGHDKNKTDPASYWSILQNLRYIQSTTDIKKFQTSLHPSLVRVLHVHGDNTALLADTGIPPCTLYNTPTFPKCTFIS